MITIEDKTTLNLFECAECGAKIALSTNVERNFRESHKTFYCPFGHQQYFPQLSDAEKLRNALLAADIAHEIKTLR